MKYNSSCEYNLQSGKTEIPDFDHAEQLGLFTKSYWERQHRTPINSANNFVVAKSGNQVHLYSEAETRPKKPTPRTLAVEQFADIFLDPSKKDRFLTHNGDHWQTNIIKEFDPSWQKLNYAKINRHLNHKSIHGVFATAATRFIAIDLDLHARPRAEFIELSTILVEYLAQSTGWHYQVDINDLNGLHAIKVFDSKRSTVKVVAELRKELAQLDPRLATVEIYPNAKNGFRLPLCRGRVLLLDQILHAINYRKSSVADVETYIQWLKKPVSMDPQQIINLIDYYAEGNQNNKVANKGSILVTCLSDSAGLLGRQRGRFADTLETGFSGFYNPNGSLNELLKLGANACWMENLSALRADELLFNYTNELNGFSSRLNKPVKLRKDINRIVKETYKALNNPVTADQVESRDKLLKSANAFRKRNWLFNDKSTWSIKGRKEGIYISVSFTPFTDDELAKIADYLTPILNTPQLDTKHFITSVAELIAIQAQAENGISHKFWKQFLEQLGIKVGNRNKVSAIIKALTELRIITRTQKPQFGKRYGRAAGYGFGVKLMEKLIADPDCERAAEEAELLVNHYWNDLAAEAECLNAK